jgi:hypothetical protein
MTKHPLTDKLCDQIVCSTPPLPRDHQNRVLSYDGRILDGMFEECFEVEKHQMRTAADWQLEQCIAWLNDTDCDDPQETAQRLREAMRPQENNS